MTAAVANHMPDYGLAMDSDLSQAGPGGQLQDYEETVLNSNKEGMDYLRKGQYKQAFEQLKYAEAAVLAKQSEDEPTNLMSVTCNNLGCYYKKVGKLHAALSYLRRALKIEVSLQTDDVTVAGTHLNVCAILSKLDKHDKALQHALCALELISSRVSGDAPSGQFQDEYSVLAIAYHNVAVERDYLHQLEEAATAYQKGYQVAKKCLGEQHALTQTLGKNADSAWQKSQASKSTVSPTAGRRKVPTADQSQAHVLPEIAGASASGKTEDFSRGAAEQARQELGEWENWQGGAARGATLPPLQTAPAYQFGAPGFQPMGASPTYAQRGAPQVYNVTDPAPPPQSAVAMAPPSFFDTVGNEVPAKAGPPLVLDSPTSRKVVPPTETEGQNPPRGTAQGRVRPPRAPRDPNAEKTAITARAQRELARSGGKTAAAPRRDAGVVAVPQQSQLLRKSAVEKIQRFWRSHYRQHVGNRDRTKREHACATRIQARWRAFQVRKKKRVKAAVSIQPHVRGWLVRRNMRRHKAAVVIQRCAIGMFARRKMKEAFNAAVRLQRNSRAKQARVQVQARKEEVKKSTTLIKCFIHSWYCSAQVEELRQDYLQTQERSNAATKIQSVYRGGCDRQIVKARRALARNNLMCFAAAVKIQALHRRVLAVKVVAEKRAARMQVMNAAATKIRTAWLGYLCRRRYQELRKEFLRHVKQVITLQRFVRGYVVRLRMWRNAIRAEDELWGAVEIQRCWRGYLGRLRWELEYEAVWSRDTAVLRMQRYMRGWLARTAVQRKRKRLARQEFEKARRRFKSAQKIQALARGVLCRYRMRALRNRKVKAANTIQRVWRGYRFRCGMWDQVYLRKTVKCQSAIRTYLVRCRRFHLIAKMIMIQRNWRRWHRYIPEAERNRRLSRRLRNREAKAI